MNVDIRSRRNLGLVLVALMAAEATAAFEGSMIWAAMSVLYELFGDPVLVGWILTSYLLVSASAAVICARLGDMYGRRRVLTWVLVIALIGSLISAIWPNIYGLLAGRAIQGVSGAVLPLCFGLVREALPRERAMFGVGLLAATISIAAGVGLMIGGLVVDYLPWHWIFYVSAIVAAVSIAMVRLWVPAAAGIGARERFDWLGGVLFAPGIALVLFAVSKGREWGWGDERTWMVLAAGLIILVVWVIHELRHRSPLVDVRLLTNRQIVLTNLCMAMAALGAFQKGPVLSLLLQQPVWTGVGLGLAAVASGAILFLANGINLLAGPWAGSLAGRFMARQPMLIGAFLMLAAWSGLTVYHGSVWFITVMLLLAGLGLGMVFASAPMLVMEVAPPERTSEATALVSVTRQVFLGVGSQLIAVLLATSTMGDPAGGAGRYPTGTAFTMAFMAITFTSLLCLMAALALPKRARLAATEQAA